MCRDTRGSRCGEHASLVADCFSPAPRAGFNSVAEGVKSLRTVSSQSLVALVLSLRHYLIWSSPARRTWFDQSAAVDGYPNSPTPAPRLTPSDECPDCEGGGQDKPDEDGHAQHLNSHLIRYLATAGLLDGRSWHQACAVCSRGLDGFQ
jgi:hypothetical protein